MPDLTTIIDQTLYFVINDAITPPSLWRSDGTASGTVEVKQFTASEWPQSLTTVNQTLFLIISDNWVTQSLWISDGTTSGTVVVKQFSDGGTSSTGMSVAGRAVFPTCSVNACQIWSSDVHNLRHRLRENPLPLLVIDREYGTVSTGQIKTRVQAFMERLGG